MTSGGSSNKVCFVLFLVMKGGSHFPFLHLTVVVMSIIMTRQDEDKLPGLPKMADGRLERAWI